MNCELSVIIPVHNGAKVLSITIANILKQAGLSFEIILVENFSSDDSARLCDELMSNNELIRSFHCNRRGTSMARKLGIEQADGKWVTFCDQDDYYKDENALLEMVSICEENDLDICQFGHFSKYAPGVYKKKSFELDDGFISFGREELLDQQIKGVLGFAWSKEVYLTSSVWDKCYRASIIKSAAKRIANQELYYNEDSFLNSFVFFDPGIRRIGISNKSYYVWVWGGSTSPESAYTYMMDLEHSKPAQIQLIRDSDCSIETVNQCYLDTLTVWYWTVFTWIGRKLDKEAIVNWITELEQLECIQQAKHALKESRYLFDVQPEKMSFITGDYTANEFYEWCLQNRPKDSLKHRIITKGLGVVASINRML